VSSFVVAVKIHNSEKRKNVMSKKNPSYVEHSKAVAALHQHISKGFSGLAASFEKASEHTRAGDCEKASDALVSLQLCAR
jgi:hypothetical protein